MKLRDEAERIRDGIREYWPPFIEIPPQIEALLEGRAAQPGAEGAMSEELDKLQSEYTHQTLRLGKTKKELDEARDIACKLLRIAEARGPRVFGPRPEWLRYED